MKKFATISILLLLLCTSVFALPKIQAGITNNGGTLIFSARPDVSFTGNYSAGILVVRWATSYGITLGAPYSPTSMIGAWDDIQTGTFGAFTYKSFAWVAGLTYALNWTAGQSYELFRVNISGGTGNGLFELAPTNFAGLLDVWYIEVGGNDYTNSSSLYFQSIASDVPLPVELSSFTSSPSGRDMSLSWTTKTENNSSSFIIERKDKGLWIQVASKDAAGTTSSEHNYSFVDKKLNSGTYTYRLKMVDNNGAYTYSKEITGEIELPKDFLLSQNYPNPFNPTSKIDYQLPYDADVVLEVFTLNGEKAITLMNSRQSAGYYTTEINGRGLSSGMYVYRLMATAPNQEPYTSIKKMILLK